MLANSLIIIRDLTSIATNLLKAMMYRLVINRFIKNRQTTMPIHYPGQSPCHSDQWFFHLRVMVDTNPKQSHSTFEYTEHHCHYPKYKPQENQYFI
jgi:hypothetical protein